MDTPILAHSAHEATDERTERWRAIQQRTTRGMLTFNAGAVKHLEGSLFAVASSRGGYWRVDLDDEVCGCEDWQHFGSQHDVACRHIVAAAISRAKRARMSRATLRHLEDRLAHEIMDDEERQELRDQVLRLRRRLGR